LTVTPEGLTITADNQTKVYGAELPALTASYSGFVNGDTAASLTSLPATTTTATAGSHVAGGPYAITASGAADSDYSITYVAGTLTVTPVTLMITADNQSKVYGAALPTLTATYSGFVNGDTSASLSSQLELSTTATASSHVSGSPYAITASGAVDSDYAISYATGFLTITPAGLTITADNQTKVYGAALPALTASYSGFVNGDTAASLTTGPTLSTTATAHSDIGAYAITARGADDADYMITYVDGTMTVTQAGLVITADNQTKVYGAALPTLTVSYSGFINGDTSASLTTLPTLTTTATANSDVSGNPYTITASGAVDSDYTITYVAGSLNVTPAPLTITADNQTKMYGAALPTLTASYSGFVNGDTSASLTTQPTLTTTATAGSHVAGGPYAITASGAADPDYSISYVAGSLIVTPVNLTITADNQTKAYGAALPTLTASYAGFVNGDTSVSLTTQPTLTTTAAASSHVSGNPYTITASGAVDLDYSISYVSGALSVTPVALTITANNQTKVYGAALPTLTASYGGFVNGDTAANLDTEPTLITTATDFSHAGTYAITASGAVDADYSISYAPGTLTVTPEGLTITADNQTKVYGAELPALTASYSGFVNGDTAASLTTQPALITTATDISHAGNYAITASGAVDTDYTISYAGGTLTVTPAALAIIAPNQIKVYGAALPTLTATYSGFVNGDTSASLSTQPTLGTTATASSHVSGNPYIVTTSGAADSDYAISYVSGTLTVTPAELTITADYQTKVYGGTLPTLTARYIGLVNGDTAASMTTQPMLSTTATVSSHVSDNPYAITASGAFDSDYAISYVPGLLTIIPAALTITADNQAKVYGAALPNLTASYSGFVNGDTAANLDAQPTISTAATAHSGTGDYVITASGAADSDYTITYHVGTLAITPATLTVSADDLTRPKGEANPPLTYSISGLVNGDTINVVSGTPVLSTTATTSSPSGTYPIAIAVGNLSAANYDFATAGGILTVADTSAITITLTASPGSTATYGQVLNFTSTVSPTVSGDPAPTGTVQFLVNGSPIGSAVTLVGGSATSDLLNSPGAGGHTIEAIYSGDGFYATTAQTLTLTVIPATLTITADNQTKVYGAAMPNLAVSYSGFVNGDTAASFQTQPTVSTTATAHSGTGAYAINASGAVDANYTISYVPGDLAVTPATLIVSANELTRPQGETNPPLTYSLSGFVIGDTASIVSGTPTLSTTATIVSPNGQYPITIAVGTLSAANYNFTTAAGTLTIIDMSAIIINPTSLPVATVGSHYSQQLTASGGSGAGYRFSATGVPDGLSLSSSGLLSGTPTTASGTPVVLDVTATDGGGGTGSQNFSLTVEAEAIAGKIVSSLAQSHYGQEVTLTATFSATPEGPAPMTGTVAFYDGNTYLGTGPLIATGVADLRAATLFMAVASPTVSGMSNLSTLSLAVGNHIIKAIYSGDANYPTASVETPVSVQVIPAVTSTTLTASTSPQGTALVANVVVTSPGNPPIVGSVSFYNGGTLLGTYSVSNGVATLNVSSLSGGVHSFNAVFSDDGNFSTSESSLVISTDGPQVTSVLRYGFHAQPTYLLIGFDGPLDSTSAQNPSNYHIIAPGGHRIKLTSAIYDSRTQTVTIVPSSRLNLHWRYNLTINGMAPSGLTNPSGDLLDGAGNGQPGSDYVTSITWGKLAGTARKLPTLRLVDPPNPHPRHAQTSSHRHVQTKLHAAAVDHLLTTGSLHVRCGRAMRS
jgi:diphthamide synthase (EF-2-diphthine--ammonia ligase)